MGVAVAAGGVGVATRGAVATFVAAFFLCFGFGLGLGRCRAGSAATLESDGAAIVASVVSSVAAAGAETRRVLGHDGGVRAQDGGGRERGQEHRGGDDGEDGGDRTVGHTPAGHFVRRPLADRHRSERTGAAPRRITNVVRFPR